MAEDPRWRREAASLAANWAGLFLMLALVPWRLPVPWDLCIAASSAAAIAVTLALLERRRRRKEQPPHG